MVLRSRSEDGAVEPGLQVVARTSHKHSIRGSRKLPDFSCLHSPPARPTKQQLTTPRPVGHGCVSHYRPTEHCQEGSHSDSQHLADFGSSQFGRPA